MKVAFTTSNGSTVDGNFCKTSSYSVWDIAPDEAYYVTTVQIGEQTGTEDDRIVVRAEALKGCAIVCVKQINGPAVAKLATRKIHAMRIGKCCGVEEIIVRLQEALRHSPAPWMRKAMAADGYGPPHVDRDNWILDASVIDVLTRHPETTDLMHGAGLSLFSDKQSLIDDGILLSIREALGRRGISPDLFQLLLERTISESPRLTG